VCIIVESQDDVAAFKDFVDDGKSAPAPAAKPSAAPAPPPPPAPSAAAPIAQAVPVSMPAPGGRVFASPFARKLAAEQGLDISVFIKSFYISQFMKQILK